MTRSSERNLKKLQNWKIRCFVGKKRW